MILEILLGVALALLLLPLFSLLMTGLSKVIQRLLDKQFTKDELLGLSAILSRFLSILVILLGLAVIFFMI